MKTIDTRRYEMLVRVRDFYETHETLFPESSLAREQFARVTAAVTELSGHAVVTMAAPNEGRSNKVMAREALIEELATISRTARGIAEDTAGLEDKFVLPSPASNQALLTAGRLFARDAKAFESQFIAHAMPQTFLADLNALVDKFEAAIHDRVAGKEDQIAAMTNIKAAIASGYSAVRKLDAILANQLHGDAATLAVWQHDRRVEYARRGKKKAKTPASAATASTAEAPAAGAAPAAAAAPAAQTSAPSAVPQATGGVPETTGVKS